MDNNGMYDSLLEKVRHFVALYEKVKAEKGELEQKNISLQKQVSFLQNENNQLKTDNELLNMELAEQNKKVVELSEKVSSQNNVNSEIESKLMAILSALPDDKDDNSVQNDETPINIAAVEQNTETESTAAPTENMPHDEDPADAILNKFMSFDTETDSDSGFIGNVGFAEETAPQENVQNQDYGLLNQNDEPANNNENVETPNNDINDYVGLFGETAEDNNTDNGQPTLFGDNLPTEDEWNGNSAAEETSPENDIQSEQGSNESVLSFFDEPNQNETANESIPSDNQQSAETANMTENEYAANDIQSDDYSSILLSDDDSDEEVDFDMDDDESDEADEDVSGGDFEDGYAPGVM